MTHEFQVGSPVPFHFFQVSPDGNYAVLFFTLMGNGHEILVKDLKQDCMVPVFFQNVDDSIAFDKQFGFYYSQLDPTGRSATLKHH